MLIFRLIILIIPVFFINSSFFGMRSNSLTDVTDEHDCLLYKKNYIPEICYNHDKSLLIAGKDTNPMSILEQCGERVIFIDYGNQATITCPQGCHMLVVDTQKNQVIHGNNKNENLMDNMKTIYKNAQLCNYLRNNNLITINNDTSDNECDATMVLSDDELEKTMVLSDDED